MQGTRKPILPVHSQAEKELFLELMTSCKEFNPPTGEPLWGQAIKIWNTEADERDGISYKVCSL